ncbi:oxidoreductase [Penicillium macrosclerotiorum]|uniref:oxidoreductase n=1 Tax=Penicillium macrosclerotiorum TaxID=303699 RepID=UPI0025467F15|nr:oxidoreductase [Penicillium macrosclerotiorum]KAJ5689964.1 oxidoreductase [Penicillium macrosclerotiorum]
MATTISSTIKLASGYEIPRLGFGVCGFMKTCWQKRTNRCLQGLSNVTTPPSIFLSCLFHVLKPNSVIFSPPEKTKNCCLEALKCGYRHVSRSVMQLPILLTQTLFTHIDSAVAYRNEASCGEAIRDPGISGLLRDQIFFTSKVIDISYVGAKTTVDETLAKTKLGYIDLMLLHKPMGGSENRKGAWKALVEAVEAGKVRSIGVSNYGVHHLDELEQHIGELEAERGGKGKGGIVSINQVELHPWLGRKDIVDWCMTRGIALEAYCPVVRGERFKEPAVRKLADKYSKTPAQILIRWSLDKGFIPLPKSVTPSRIRENGEVFDFQLTPEEVQELETGEYSPVAWDPTVSKLDD